MDKDLAHQAISEALAGNWKKAVEINLKILREDPNEVDALNRLARALAETGNFIKAKATAKKVLKIDPFNKIAIRSLEKYKKLKKGQTYLSLPSRPDTFLEEPGKTRLVSLIHLGGPEVLAKLDSADEVKLNTRSHRVTITSLEGAYVGKLPDDVSARIKKLTKYGNEYKAFVKSADKNEVKVFIKETKRAPKLSDLPSFPTEKIDYVSFTPPELVHKKEEILSTEDDTDD